MHQRNPRLRQSADQRRVPQWIQFDEWLERHERATGRDAFRPSIPGGPRGY